MGVSHSDFAGVRFQPEVSHTFLPGCANCGSAHPLAIKSASDKTVCPGCGAPAGQPGRTTTQVGAMGGGPLVWIGLGMLAIGRLLANLSRKV